MKSVMSTKMVIVYHAVQIEKSLWYSSIFLYFFFLINSFFHEYFDITCTIGEDCTSIFEFLTFEYLLTI